MLPEALKLDGDYAYLAGVLNYTPHVSIITAACVSVDAPFCRAWWLSPILGVASEG